MALGIYIFTYIYTLQFTNCNICLLNVSASRTTSLDNFQGMRKCQQSAAWYFSKTLLVLCRAHQVEGCTLFCLSQAQSKRITSGRGVIHYELQILIRVRYKNCIRKNLASSLQESGQSKNELEFPNRHYSATVDRVHNPLHGLVSDDLFFTLQQYLKN